MVIGDETINYDSLVLCGAHIPVNTPYHWYHSVHFPQGREHVMPKGPWLHNCEKTDRGVDGEDIKAAAICDRCWKRLGYCW